MKKKEFETIRSYKLKDHEVAEANKHQTKRTYEKDEPSRAMNDNQGHNL